jgi:GTP-binding protein Era
MVVDLDASPGAEDRLLAERVKASRGERPLILALNKTDLVDPLLQARRQDAYLELVGAAMPLSISAAQSTGLAELLETLFAALPEGEPFFPEEQVTDLAERQIAADLIREAALNLLRDEVPHGIAVRIDEYIERDEKGAKIEATIFVERESHKGIVIGQGGQMIKDIGIAARKEIERMSSRKVFLRLRVKVRPGWRDDDAVLDRFGFQKRGRT